MGYKKDIKKIKYLQQQLCVTNNIAKEQSDMSIIDTSDKSYVKHKNRVLELTSDSNVAVAWDDAELFNENQNLSVTLTDVPLGHSFILTSGIGAKITIVDGGFTIINLRDNLEVNEKESAIIHRMTDGRFLIRG